MNSFDMVWSPGTATNLTAAPFIPDAPPVVHGMNHADERADDMRLRILNAVADALRAAGRDITDMEPIVAMADLTVRQIGDEFGCMDQLIIALVEQLCAPVVEPLARQPTEASFEMQLLEFSNRLVDAYASSHLRNLYRIALAAAIKHISIGRAFYQRGPGGLTAELARFIRDAHEVGAIHAPDSLQLASHFVALLRADVDLSGTSVSPQNRRDVTRVIELFHSGIRTGEKHAPTDC